MLLKLSTLALLPAIVLQGYRVKKNTPRLPEPTGDRHGIVGQGPKLSVLILGDSAAAGVGVDHQDQALLGALLAKLSDQYCVAYRLEAKTGHNSAQVLAASQGLAPQHYDVVVTSVGVNDVTRFRQPKTWIAEQKKLYADIEQRFSPNLVVVSGVPPMDQFPALPNPLGWLFGRYAAQMNQLLAEVVHSQPHYEFLKYDVQQYQSLNLSMARDGFHPSAEIYAFWADEVADRILKHHIEV
ncbi:lysophospholipase L1-like esterase [Acinetobacter calcoaceticus]|uniref:Lysophospholipase L1-like esterase n=1 Tax=Acinetobacter calcoaceticus TaxID=471 RepID=A0A4R1XS96_ACICA|nr:lysophospholipase L1-like esterase [Acinetobacter calcoaceticus]